MENDAFLVRRRWLEKVDAAINKTDSATKQPGEASLFYDVRPAVLHTAWTQNAAGLYCATAYFLVNDAADSSFEFNVFAPTATSSPGGTVDSTRFFVVWRGRWEMLAGVAPTQKALVLTKVDALKALTAPTASFLKTATPSTGSFLTSASTTKTTETKSLLTNVTVSSGALVFTSENVTYATDVATTTQTGTAVTGVSTTSGNAVTSASASTEKVLSNVEYAQ